MDYEPIKPTQCQLSMTGASTLLASGLALKVGDTVKYSKPSGSERDFRFKIIQGPDDRGKVTIQLIDDNYRIKPIEVVAISEVERA